MDGGRIRITKAETVGDRAARPRVVGDAPMPGWQGVPGPSALAPARADGGRTSRRVLACGAGIVLALAAGLLVWFLVPGSSRMEVEAMERVLLADAAAMQRASTIAEAASRIRGVGLEGCPRDFREAHVRLMHDYESLLGIEAEIRALEVHANSGDVILESFVRGLMGDPFGTALELSAAEQELQNRWRSAVQSAWESWQQLESIAASRGAGLPPAGP